MNIHKDDEVMVMTGKDKGKRGKVHSVDPGTGRLVVAGVHMIKRHMKPGRVRTQVGIVEREAPIAVSNVMLVCNKCGKPTRVAYRFVENGQKVRACHECGEIIDTK